MIVLGGLLDERETEVTAKIPGLGDIPLIGACSVRSRISVRK